MPELPGPSASVSAPALTRQQVGLPLSLSLSQRLLHYYVIALLIGRFVLSRYRRRIVRLI